MVFALALLVLVFFGVYLDQRQGLASSQLFFAFHVSGIVGVCLSAYLFLRRMRASWQRVLLVVLTVLIWRISYFPIMVLAGFMAGLGEYLLGLIGWRQVYPVFLVGIAFMNFIAIAILGLLLIALARIAGEQKRVKTLFDGVLASVSLPLAVIAIAVSFSQPSDWHALPDTSFLDTKPLPNPVLPEFNPYWLALDEPGLGWNQKILFAAAAMTYDLVPDETHWSQVVKGTLEKEFVTTKRVSTAFCTKIHYRAFMTAQPFILSNERFSELGDSE